MSNFIENIPPLTEEELEELKALEGREIDFSDIPPISKEELNSTTALTGVMASTRSFLRME